MERIKIFLTFIIIFLPMFSCQTIKNTKNGEINSYLGYEIGNWKGKLNDNTSIKLSLYKNGNALLYKNNKLLDPFENKKGIVYYVNYNSNPIELAVVFMKNEGTSEMILLYIEFLSKELLRVFTNFDQNQISDIKDVKNIFLLRRY